MTDLNHNTFKGLHSDDDVIARARALFKNACENTDSYHALRLGLARRKALNAGTAHRFGGFWTALAGTAVACCVLAVGAVWLRAGGQPGQAAAIASTHAAITAEPASPRAAGAPEIGNGQIEMVEDLAFYRWVADQPALSSAGSRGSR
jgi:hypothetical protein